MISPGGREDSGNIGPVPTMDGLHVGDRKGMSQFQGSDLSPASESFPFWFQIMQTLTATNNPTGLIPLYFQEVNSKYANDNKKNMQCPIYTVLKRGENTNPKILENKPSLILKTTNNSQHALQ